MKEQKISTGLKELDQVLNSLHRGDNVVWQVNEIEHYRYFAQPFAQKSKQKGKKLVYIRFAAHKPIIKVRGKNLKYCNLKPVGDFEDFTTRVYNIITEEGKNTHYIFDSLSELLTSWATDLMIGNFFKIICPYLFDVDTIAYFGILRNQHSYDTISEIRKTTQLFLDLYQDKNQTYYLHPLKVWNRYSQTMFLPHIYQEGEFVPITNSHETTGLFSEVLQPKERNSSRQLDYWDKLFMEARRLVEKQAQETKKDNLLQQISRLMLSQKEKMLQLVNKHFTLSDLLKIKSRLIGSGLIGGKALGMLLARKILNNSTFPSEKLEEHDSYYVGSDVFYTYIVHNDLWHLRVKQRSEAEKYFSCAQKMREELLTGEFPEQIKERFRQMLHYFGQSPIIVRSSSLLEDSYGNAFAGKYDSFFCVNQGNPENRLQNLLAAVKKVYASAMNKDALVYRQNRGLSSRDEQMALLIQRVSGDHQGNFFFPHLAGVGNSYNNFTWQKELDPEAGMLRLVFGLGTRAVNRVEKGYPRIVALDKVELNNVSGPKDSSKYSQHYLDLLNLNQNRLETKSIIDLFNNTELDLKTKKLLGKRDRKLERKRSLREQGNQDREIWRIELTSLLKKTDLADTFQQMLAELEKGYSHPIDIEFTVNLKENNDYRINLLQCRPLQTNYQDNQIQLTENIPEHKIFFSGQKSFMGGSFNQQIKKIIYIIPEKYSQLKRTEKYQLARLIGKINRENSLLIGPGRWGTTTPSLGIPVNFSEISGISVLMEVAQGKMTPELSFGAHFFQDLVEANIKYLALQPEKEDYTFNPDLLQTKENQLPELLPEKQKYHSVLYLVNLEQNPLQIESDHSSRKFIGYFK